MIRPPAAWVNEVRPVTFRLEDATDILSSHDELVQRIHVSNNIHIHARENEDGQECSAELYIQQVHPSPPAYLKQESSNM